MRYIYATFLVLIATSLCTAVEPPMVPKEIKGYVGDWIEIQAIAKGNVEFHSVNPQLKIFPRGVLAKTNMTIVSSRKPGIYKVLCWTAEDNTPSAASEIKVIILDEEDGNDHNPPNPTPPNPPSPNLSDLGKEFLRLYRIDNRSNQEDKQVWLKKLLGFYQAISQAINRQELKTVEDFRKIWLECSREILKDIPDGLLFDLRAYIGKLVSDAIGTNLEDELDGSLGLREKTRLVLNSIVRALDETLKVKI